MVSRARGLFDDVVPPVGRARGLFDDVIPKSRARGLFDDVVPDPIRGLKSLVSPLKPIAPPQVVQPPEIPRETILRAPTTIEREEPAVYTPSERDIYRKQLERLTDKAYTEATGVEPETAIKKTKQLEAIVGRAPLIASGFAAPLEVAAIEGYQQLKNIAISKLKKQKYSPLERRLLSELIPETAPKALKVGATALELGTDIALIGASLNLSKRGLLNKSIKEVSSKLKTAGYDVSDTKLNPKDLKNAIRGTTLDKEITRYAKLKKLELPPTRELPKQIAGPGAQPVPSQQRIGYSQPLINEKTITIQEAGRLKPSAVKGVIRSATGQLKSKITTPELDVLNRIYRAESKGASLGAKEARQQYKLIEGIKKNPIENMTYEERLEINNLKKELKTTRTLAGLRNLSDKINLLKEQGKQKFLDNVAKRNADFEINRDLLVKSIETAHPKKITQAGPKGISTNIEKTQYAKIARVIGLTPERVSDAIDGGQNFEGLVHKYFDNRANSMTDEELRGMDKRIDEFENFNKSLNVDPKYLESKITIGDLKLTRNEMIGIYNHSRNKQNLAALIFDNKFTVKEIKDINASLSDKDKVVADFIIKGYEDNFGRVAGAYTETTDGKEVLGRVEGLYNPMIRKGEEGIPLSEELVNDMLARKKTTKAYASRNFSKERVKSGITGKPLSLNAVGDYYNQVGKQEHFISHAKGVRDMQRMVNDRSFSKAVIDSVGLPYLESKRNFVNRVANPNIYKSQAGLSKLLNNLSNNASVAFLSLNLGTILKQFPSFAFFLEQTNPVSLLSNLERMTTNYEATVAKVNKLAPQLKHRSLDRTFDELRKRDRTQYNSILKKIGLKGMEGIYMMDKMVVYSGWLSLFEKFSKTNSVEDSARMATQFINRTQPASRPKDIADLYATSEYLNLILKFSNQQNKLYNILTYDIPTNLRKGRFQSGFRGLIGIALGATIMANIENLRKGKKATLNPADIVKQWVGYTPVVGRGIKNILSGDTYDFISLPALEWTKQLAYASRDLVKGKVASSVLRGIKVYAAAKGIPVSPLKYLKKPKTKKKSFLRR